MEKLEKVESIFAPRQIDAWKRIVKIVKDYFASVLKPVALLMTVLELLGCVLFDLPVTPGGPKLDLSDYSLVFEDEFTGDTLDLDVWHYRGLGVRRGGFNGKSSVKVENGNLVLTGEYLEDGEYGAGWYTGMIALNKHYKRGYFEIKCICNDDTDYWSAFWLQGVESPYFAELSKGGLESVELDIFEGMSADYLLPWNRNSVTTTIHCAGVYDDSDDLCSRSFGAFKGHNIYKEYNTYGMEWTEDEYIFYVNGVETARSSFGLGTCRNAEEVIVSLEIPSEMHKKNTDFKTNYIVDYVRIYEKN